MLDSSYLQVENHTLRLQIASKRRFKCRYMRLVNGSCFCNLKRGVRMSDHLYVYDFLNSNLFFLPSRQAQVLRIVVKQALFFSGSIKRQRKGCRGGRGEGREGVDLSGYNTLYLPLHEHRLWHHFLAKFV